LKLSVIIPTLNERQTIERLLSQIEPREDIEVFVVDNSSTDGTAVVAEEQGATVLICEDDVSAGRNLGAKKSTGEYLLFLDADLDLWSATPATDLLMWLKEHPEVSVGTGKLYQKFGTNNAISEMREVIRNAIPVLTGGYTLMKRPVFVKLGGFRPRKKCFMWWEDLDLSWRAVLARYRIYQLPFSVVHLRPFNVRFPNGDLLGRLG